MLQSLGLKRPCIDFIQLIPWRMRETHGLITPIAQPTASQHSQTWSYLDDRQGSQTVMEPSQDKKQDPDEPSLNCWPADHKLNKSLFL